MTDTVKTPQSPHLSPQYDAEAHPWQKNMPQSVLENARKYEDTINPVEIAESVNK